MLPMPESGGDVEVSLPPTSITALPERRRVGLKLDLSTLGNSDVRLPKRCKLESMNISINFSTTLLTPRTILPHELASKLNKSKPVLLLDCRPFFAYNQNHIQGAVNINCCDRFNRKRLQQGKCALVDLVSTKEGKDLFKRRLGKEIIVYDEQTSDLHKVTTDSTCSIHLVLASLLREGREAFVLKGGLSDFVNKHSEFCDSTVKSLEHRPLYSPTTPIIEPEIETATASQILPFLYLGNERDAANRQRLKDLNITYVLDVTSHIPMFFEGNGITYKRLPASDSGQQNLKQYFEEAIEFIDEARKNNAKLLVHCQAGVSRSATITIAYILKHTRMTMIDAYKYVKGKRTIISPNFNFMGQLMEFEQGLNQGVTPRILHPCLQGVESSV